MSNGRPCIQPEQHTRDKEGCVECRRATKKRWYENNYERSRAYAKVYQRRILGLPEPTRPDPGICEICGGKNKTERAMALDHDHVTGEFRGWLCYRCNVGIGNLGDSIVGLERALAYLKQAQK